MRIDLPALEVTGLPPNQPGAATKGFSSRQPLQPPAAHSLHTEVSTAVGKPTELMDAPEPGSREGFEIQSCHDAALRQQGATGRSLEWGQWEKKKDASSRVLQPSQ